MKALFQTLMVKVYEKHAVKNMRIGKDWEKEGTMDLLKKLKRKEEEKLYLLNLPEILQELRNEFQEVVEVHETLDETKAEFVLVFFHSQKEIRETVPEIMDRIHDDAVLWVSYPKKSSKKICSDISRDKGWEIFGDYAYEPVSQISISEDYSALRFRPLKDIRNFKRNEKMILSEEGKTRAEKEKLK